MDIDDLASVGAVIIILSLFTVFLWVIYQEGNTEQNCLAQGYSNYRYSFFGSEYCVMRKDQTDIVVPYSEAMQKRAQ